MVQFNTLQLSDDLTQLFVNVNIDTEHVSTYYIKGVYIEYYKNRNTLGNPSDKAFALYLNPSEEGGVPDKNKVSYSGAMNKSDIVYDDFGVDTFKGGLFYCIVVVENKTDSDDQLAEVAACLDWTTVYDYGMGFVSQVYRSCGAGSCNINEDLEQAVLCWHAIELAMAANDADQLDKLWSRFVTFSPNAAAGGSTCNCR